MNQLNNRQHAIYDRSPIRGLPSWPVDYTGLEQQARVALSPGILNYVQGGCGDGRNRFSNHPISNRIVGRICSTTPLAIQPPRQLHMGKAKFGALAAEPSALCLPGNRAIDLAAAEPS